MEVGVCWRASRRNRFKRKSGSELSSCCSHRRHHEALYSGSICNLAAHKCCINLFLFVHMHLHNTKAVYIILPFMVGAFKVIQMNFPSLKMWHVTQNVTQVQMPATSALERLTWNGWLRTSMKMCDAQLITYKDTTLGCMPEGLFLQKMLLSQHGNKNLFISKK